MFICRLKIIHYFLGSYAFILEVGAAAHTQWIILYIFLHLFETQNKKVPAFANTYIYSTVLYILRIYYEDVIILSICNMKLSSYTNVTICYPLLLHTYYVLHRLKIIYLLFTLD